MRYLRQYAYAGVRSKENQLMGIYVADFGSQKPLVRQEVRFPVCRFCRSDSLPSELKNKNIRVASKPHGPTQSLLQLRNNGILSML